jgi:hypothetical protein
MKQIYWKAIQSRFFDTIRPRISHIGYYLLKGKARGTNYDLSILVFAGYENIVHYMSNLAYSEKPQITALGRVNYQRIPSIIVSINPDIVFAEFNEIFTDFFSKTFLILPRINFTLDISPPLETIIARMRRIRKRSIRKIEKFPYTFEVTRNLDKFNFFYHKIYAPFVSKTAREDFARSTPIAIAKEWFLKGELLFVKSNEEYLSGLLYHPENKSVHCRLISYTEGMAGQAALYYLIQRSKEKGYTKINYGETSPFMSDGLFLYKRSWGMKIKPKLKGSPVLAIKLCNFEEAVQNFLASNPFIFTDFKGLIGLTLQNSDHIDINSVYRKFYTPGLQKLIILYPRKKRNTLHLSTFKTCPLPTLSPIDFLVKLVSKMDFDACLIDFSTQRL